MTKVFSDINPIQYELSDLQKTKLKRRFYREELTKSPPPTKSDYFFVEKILKERQIKGKKEYFVKYLYYPMKFCQWVPEHNLVRSN